MQVTSVTRVLVWSRWLRASHWFMAVACLGLILTGWLMSADSLLAMDAREIHLMLSGILIPALLVRVYLLFFGGETDLLSDLEPTLHKLNQAVEVLRFYLTLGKAPLPKWFSHNPLWGPIYLLLLLFVIISSLSGVLLTQEISFLHGISIHDLHSVCHYTISIFSLLHLPAVFSHDLSNKNSDISGMVNGYKIFHVEKPDQTGVDATPTVTLDALLKSKK